MIWNIIDRRRRPHRWARVNAIVEAVDHDNFCADADQAPVVPDAIAYDQRAGVSVAEAIIWANGLGSAVTLYLYDDGDGIA